MSYTPDIAVDLSAVTLTMANDNLHWLYAVLTVVIDEETLEETRTATIEASELHIDPLRYWESDGKIYYKLGWVDPVTNGERQAHLLWNGQKQPSKATDSEVITANEETNINHYLAPDHLHLLEAYCVGGRGDGGDTHVAALIGTDPAVAGVMVYEDQLIDWNN